MRLCCLARYSRVSFWRPSLKMKSRVLLRHTLTLIENGAFVAQHCTESAVLPVILMLVVVIP